MHPEQKALIPTLKDAKFLQSQDHYPKSAIRRLGARSLEEALEECLRTTI
jgi:hypothetical protein